MKYLAFFIVVGLSGSVIRRLDWPGWAQVGVLLVVNLVAGAVIFGSQEQDKREGQQQ